MRKYINEDGTPFSKDQFIDKIKNDKEFSDRFGNLGPIYGKQWRSWRNPSFPKISKEFSDICDGRTHIEVDCPIDQISELITQLKENPDSRRLMVNAWAVHDLPNMVLPPCHYGFQVYTRELSYEERCDIFKPTTDFKTETNSVLRDLNIEIMNDAETPTRAISLMWNQRSVDTFLGLPFNIASYGLLLEIIAKEVNMVPEELIGNLGDVHLYSNHVEQAKEQIGREYTHEERTELLKQAMGDVNYNKALDELMPFGGGLSEYYDSYKIPYATREPFSLPTLVFNPIFLANLDHKGFDEAINGQVNFKVENYQSHAAIPAPLSN